MSNKTTRKDGRNGRSLDDKMDRKKRIAKKVASYKDGKYKPHYEDLAEEDVMDSRDIVEMNPV